MRINKLAITQIARGLRENAAGSPFSGRTTKVLYIRVRGSPLPCLKPESIRYKLKYLNMQIKTSVCGEMMALI